jgi:hypothetical protein
LGAKYHPRQKRYIAPRAETFRRALGAIDVETLDEAVDAWLLAAPWCSGRSCQVGQVGMTAFAPRPNRRSRRGETDCPSDSVRRVRFRDVGRGTVPMHHGLGCHSQIGSRIGTELARLSQRGFDAWGDPRGMALAATALATTALAAVGGMNGRVGTSVQSLWQAYRQFHSLGDLAHTWLMMGPRVAVSGAGTLESSRSRISRDVTLMHRS